MPEAETESVARCPLCTEESSRPLLRGVDRLHGLIGEFGVVECARCGFLRTCPRPTAAALAAYYPGDYEPHAAPSPPRTPDPARFADRQRLALLKTRFGYAHLDAPALSPWSPLRAWPRPPFRLPPFLGDGVALDVGCGSGSFLLRLRAFGWTARGLDLSPAAVELARSAGLEVARGTLCDLDARSESFDLVRFASVLEHVPDPVGELSRARELIGAGGRIQLILPNAGGLGFRLFKTHWFPLDLPRHLGHFTPHTLGDAARRAGLMVEGIRHHSGPRGLQRSLAYRFPGLRRLWHSTLSRRLLSPIASALDFVGRGDSMEVWLRRP